MMRTVAAAATVVTSVVLLGCGGGDEEERKAPPRPSPAAREASRTPGEAATSPTFLRKADAACADAKRRVAPIYHAVEAKVADMDAAGVAVELRKALPIADALVERMRALAPPADDEAFIAQYLETIAQQRRRISSLAAALEAEDISRIELLAAQLRQGNRRAQRLAKRYGSKDCTPRDLPTG